MTPSGRRMPVNADHRLSRQRAMYCPLSRGTGPGTPRQNSERHSDRRRRIRRRGQNGDCWLLAPCWYRRQQVLDATVANMRFVKPIDRELILELSRNIPCSSASACQSVVPAPKSPAYSKHAKRRSFIGLPDRFIEHGDQTLAAGRKRARQRRHHSHRTNLSETTGNTMKPAQNEKNNNP